jgi:hypothetical protein
VERPTPLTQKVEIWRQKDINSGPDIRTTVASSVSTPTINTLGVNNNKYQGDWLV